MPLHFDESDLAPKEDTVSFGDRQYIIVEATEDAATKYRNCMMAATRIGADGKPVGTDGIAQAEPLLVSLCMFEVYDKDKRRPVLLRDVLKWPSQLVGKIFARIQEISNLAEKLMGREQVHQALSLEGSPITLDALKKYALSLDGDYPYFKALFLDEEEIAAKKL